jgi:hypothetical protein
MDRRLVSAIGQRAHVSAERFLDLACVKRESAATFMAPLRILSGESMKLADADPYKRLYALLEIAGDGA